MNLTETVCELSQMVVYVLRLINTNPTKTVWTITDGGLLIKIEQHEPYYNCVWTITDGGLLIKIDQHEPH